MSIKQDEVIFLLGAGASIQADIPASADMIREIEKLIDGDWKKYKSLYYFLKSSILFSDGIAGKFNENYFNIERLINTIDELLKSDQHPLFPFIGSWAPKLSDVTGYNLSFLGEFRKDIVKIMSSDWLWLKHDNKAHYYSKFNELQNSMNFKIRIFTLNYDLCIEKSCKNNVERGFGSSTIWDWKIFDDESNITKGILLYKLHGSLDWTRDQAGGLVYQDSPISNDALEIIFGTTYKLQYSDPFLFFAYEFRKRSMTDANLIICIGYGFADQHINKILSQALRGNEERKLVIVSPLDNENEKSRKESIQKVLELTNNLQIEIINMKAKEYMESEMTVDKIARHIHEDDVPF